MPGVRGLVSDGTTLASLPPPLPFRNRLNHPAGRCPCTRVPAGTPWSRYTDDATSPHGKFYGYLKPVVAAAPGVRSEEGGGPGTAPAPWDYFNASSFAGDTYLWAAIASAKTKLRFGHVVAYTPVDAAPTPVVPAACGAAEGAASLPPPVLLAAKTGADAAAVSRGGGSESGREDAEKVVGGGSGEGSAASKAVAAEPPAPVTDAHVTHGSLTHVAPATERSSAGGVCRTFVLTSGSKCRFGDGCR